MTIHDDAREAIRCDKGGPHALRYQRLLDEIERLRICLDGAFYALAKIGDKAHDLSSGPAVPDGYWELRGMAYDAAQPGIDEAIDKAMK